MRNILSNICNKYEIPAISAAWGNSNGLQMAEAFGVRKWGTETPVTINDLWHIGSNTKIMTSTLAAIIISQGKLRWNSTISEVFPDLLKSFCPELKDITLLQILSHRAGLLQNIDYDALSNFRSVKNQRIEAVKIGLSRKSFPVGEFLYSNLGYIIAGAIIERVTGLEWENAITENVFNPLGMYSAGFGGLGTSGQIDQPWGHETKKNPNNINGPEADNPIVCGPAGRVHCSIQDWAKFLTDQLRGSLGETALLKNRDYEIIQTPHFGGNYALGLAVIEPAWANGKAFAHSGCNTLYFAVYMIAPKRNFFVLVCTNLGIESEKAANETVSQIIDMAMPKSDIKRMV